MTRSRNRGRRGNRWFGFLRAYIASDQEERGPLRDSSAAEVLAWADAHHAGNGKWPSSRSGPIPQAPGESWLGVEAALRWGLRGFSGGSTLARFLAEHRRKRNRLDPLSLSVKQVLVWADAFHQRTGRWPRSASGPISGTFGLTWSMVENALRHGRGGFPGGSTLLRLLAAKRGVLNRFNPPDWTQRQILAWADAFHRRTRKWPNCHSGPIPGAGGETWYAVDRALRQGKRGFPGGSSVAHLLVTKRRIWSRGYRPKLTLKEILAWADAFHARLGRWPNYRDGAIPGTSGETWRSVHQALLEGLRGFPGGSSLAKLLARKRGVRNIQDLPRLTSGHILRWAKAHYRRTGAWPTADSGPVLEAPGERWANIDQAVRKGMRGFPGGSSLFQLLKKQDT